MLASRQDLSFIFNEADTMKKVSSLALLLNRELRMYDVLKHTKSDDHINKGDDWWLIEDAEKANIAFVRSGTYNQKRYYSEITKKERGRLVKSAQVLCLT